MAIFALEQRPIFAILTTDVGGFTPLDAFRDKFVGNFRLRQVHNHHRVSSVGLANLDRKNVFECSESDDPRFVPVIKLLNQ